MADINLRLSSFVSFSYNYKNNKYNYLFLEAPKKKSGFDSLKDAIKEAIKDIKDHFSRFESFENKIIEVIEDIENCTIYDRGLPSQKPIYRGVKMRIIRKGEFPGQEI